jgi:NAD(P)H dehydrogenase (quinone)
MNVLIIYAHPEPNSFNGAMKDMAVTVLSGAGHRVQVSDLYAMKFNPSGGPVDFMEREDASRFHYQREQMYAHKNSLFTPELRAEIEKLLWADFVIFQFPLWWFSLPAILKGWVDRVFAMGVTYDYGRAYDKGFFPQKRGMLALTTGGAKTGYVPGSRNGDIHELLFHINHGMLKFVGLEVLPPFIAYNAGRATPEERAEYLAEFRDRLLSIETTDPMRFEPVSQQPVETAIKH